MIAEKLVRWSQMTGWRGALLAVLTGAGIALGQAPYSLFWLAFPAICLAVFLGMSCETPRAAVRRGMLIGTGFATVTFVWIVEPFLVDVAKFGWMAPFALIFMASGIGLFWAGAFWAARRLAATGSNALALAIAVFWTGAEMLRSYALTGFPWGLTSYIWIDTPIYQLASFVGPHGVTLATVLLAAGLVIFLRDGRHYRAVAGVAVFAVAWLSGMWMQGQTGEATSDKRPVIRLIQPNATQKQKWDPEFMPVFYNRQLALTAEPAETPLDLVVWPEVAVPFLLNDPGAPFAEISAAAGGVPVAIGAQRLDGARAFNSVAVLGSGGGISQIYDKAHLVPFGEYLPGAELLGKFGLKALTAQYGNGYSAGPGPRVLDMGALGKVMPLICYESIFPQELRRVEQRPDWMLMVTNDGWFGKLVGPFQHLAQSRARAIEFSLPVVRAANTGVSAVIDARGNIIDSLPLNVSGRLDVALPQTLPASIYWKFGDLPTLLMLLSIGLGLLATRFRRPIVIDRQQARL